jgi:hypothetical protein
VSKIKICDLCTGSPKSSCSGYKIYITKRKARKIRFRQLSIHRLSPTPPRCPALGTKATTIPKLGSSRPLPALPRRRPPRRPNAPPDAPPPGYPFPPSRPSTHLPRSALPPSPATTWSSDYGEGNVDDTSRGTRLLTCAFSAC